VLILADPTNQTIFMSLFRKPDDRAAIEARSDPFASEFLLKFNSSEGVFYGPDATCGITQDHLDNLTEQANDTSVPRIQRDGTALKRRWADIRNWLTEAHSRYTASGRADGEDFPAFAGFEGSLQYDCNLLAMASFQGKPTLAATIRRVPDTAALEEGVPGGRTGAAAKLSGISISISFSKRTGDNGDIAKAVEKLADSIAQPVNVGSGNALSVSPGGHRKRKSADLNGRKAASELRVRYNWKTHGN
jgi:hypothetical protein